MQKPTLIRSARLGDPIHFFAQTDRGTFLCGFGWIEGYDRSSPEGRCTIMFLTPNPQQPVVRVELVAHQPSPVGIEVPGGQRLITWHFPKECPWER